MCPLRFVLSFSFPFTFCAGDNARSRTHLEMRGVIILWAMAKMVVSVQEVVVVTVIDGSCGGHGNCMDVIKSAQQCRLKHRFRMGFR